MFEFSTDLLALKEIFLINDVSAECVRERRSGQEIENSFSNLVNTSFFWKDLMEKRLQKLKAGDVKIDQLETISTEDGGHRILMPHLWDQVLYRSVGILSTNKCHVFEFARGMDWEYMKKIGIIPNEVYYRCFSIIFHANMNVTVNNSLIIHVFASRAEREQRNQIRKMRGEHFVSQQTMNEIYGSDVFSFVKERQSEFFHGFLSHRLPIPVISVDNTPPNPEHNFGPVINLLKPILDLHN
ncbi:MAG: hypothetical protein ABIC57_03425 [bacterium]